MLTALRRHLVPSVAIGLTVALWVALAQTGGNPVDAWCYWITDPAAPYGREHYQFVYTPAVTQVIAPLLELPFEIFVAVIRGGELIALTVLVGPLAPAAFLLPPVATEINAANINLILAVVIVLGFRWPALWCVALLTKPSLGVGLLWYAARGEWRNLAVALGTTTAIVAASVAIAPPLWIDWMSLLATGTPDVGEWPFPYPIWLRLPIAVALVVWGARTNRRWTVIAAAFIALPRLYFLSPALLLGVLPLLAQPRAQAVALVGRVHELGIRVGIPSAPVRRPA